MTDRRLQKFYDQQYAIAQAAIRGDTTPEIIAEFGVGRDCISRATRAFGVHLNRRPRPGRRVNKPSDKHRAMLELHETGMAQIDIAERFRVTPTAVRWAIKRYGPKKEPPEPQTAPYRPGPCCLPFVRYRDVVRDVRGAAS